MNCVNCHYPVSTLGCDNPACDLAHWHTEQTLAAKCAVESRRAEFEKSIYRIDYSLSFERRK